MAAHRGGPQKVCFLSAALQAREDPVAEGVDRTAVPGPREEEDGRPALRARPLDSNPAWRLVDPEQRLTLTEESLGAVRGRELGRQPVAQRVPNRGCDGFGTSPHRQRP